jgi:hypothetical protein
VTGFVDPTDAAAVEAVLRAALETVGVAGVIAQLSAVPDLVVVPGRSGGLFRSAAPSSIEYADQRLTLDDHRASLDHVVGGIVLASDPVSRVALPGVLAALVVRSLVTSGAHDDVAVLLTALRDAVDVAR